MKVHQIPAREDNYIQILDDDHLDHCAVIDATSFELIDQYCQDAHKKLSAIFMTHHHPDHTEGLQKLCEKYHCPVYGAQKDHHRIPQISHFVKDGDVLQYGPYSLHVLETPGHTLAHISYYLKTPALLFCGDVLFRFGCGRLFEGTPEQMVQSLKKLMQLPAETTVYCAHEYTLSNLQFCLELEPDHEGLKTLFAQLQQQRDKNEPTVPFPLKEQIELSPFLRWGESALKTTLHLPATASDVEVFTAVRQRRNFWRR